MEESKYLSR